MPTMTRPVLTIVVTNDRWNAFGDDTPANRNLIEILKAQGGISDSVPPGTYHFTIIQHGIALPELSLTPAE